MRDFERVPSPSSPVGIRELRTTRRKTALRETGARPWAVNRKNGKEAGARGTFPPVARLLPEDRSSGGTEIEEEEWRGRRADLTFGLQEAEEPEDDGKGEPSHGAAADSKDRLTPPGPPTPTAAHSPRPPNPTPPFPLRATLPSLSLFPSLRFFPSRLSPFEAVPTPMRF